MRKKMKILIVVCLMTFACFVVWSFVENAAMKDFHLLVYEEAESFDSSAQDSDSGGSRVIQAFSNPRSVYDSEETGKRTYLKTSYMIPGTITASLEPEWVTYRSKQENVTLSLPYGVDSRELTVSWDNAKEYVQLWIVVTLDKQALSNLSSTADRPEEMRYCIDGLEDSFLEIELQYTNGKTSRKTYSIYPGAKDEFGLDYVIMTESEG